TEPYALWLQSRLDYLDVAEELRKARPPASSRPGETLPPRANPPAQTEREVWIRKTAERPWPERAKPYMNLLRPVFVEEKVPPELIWVAEVESSFDPRARSPAGAAGLFQLMPGTARHYGLRTSFFDQRYKPE